MIVFVLSVSLRFSDYLEDRALYQLDGGETEISGDAVARRMKWKNGEHAIDRSKVLPSMIGVFAQ